MNEIKLHLQRNAVSEWFFSDISSTGMDKGPQNGLMLAHITPLGLHFIIQKFVTLMVIIFVQAKYLNSSLTCVFFNHRKKSVSDLGLPIWILLKQETVSSSGISWAIRKSALRPDR